MAEEEKQKKEPISTKHEYEDSLDNRAYREKRIIELLEQIAENTKVK